ncbi:MAG: hypothetical protein DLM62_20585 [Pseudonocardiales bacterium]|nr:MAG: hypothetical protein DLM62_20585 [Pseudonocardiales bacterium]
MAAIGRHPAQRDLQQRDPASPSYQQDPGEGQDLFQPVDPCPDMHSNDANDSSAPPWADSDLPPIADQQSAWLRQGPEVFQTPAMRSRSQLIIGIAVLVVVVLGLVGATVAYFLTTGPGGRTGNPQLAAPQATAAPRDLPSPPTPLPPPVDTAHALADPPGQTRGGGGLFDLPTLLTESSPPLAQPIVKALQAGGMADGVLKASTTGGTTVGLFALTTPDQQAATTVAQEIATAQLDGGFKADDNRALQGMAVMASAPGSGSATYRAVYVLYNRAIFVDVSGPNRDAVQVRGPILPHPDLRAQLRRPRRPVREPALGYLRRSAQRLGVAHRASCLGDGQLAVPGRRTPRDRGGEPRCLRRAGFAAGSAIGTAIGAPAGGIGPTATDRRVSVSDRGPRWLAVSRRGRQRRVCAVPLADRHNDLVAPAAYRGAGLRAAVRAGGGPG